MDVSIVHIFELKSWEIKENNNRPANVSAAKAHPTFEGRCSFALTKIKRIHIKQLDVIRM